MPNSYQSMVGFFELIKKFAINNPDREITPDFVYSELNIFNLPVTQTPYKSIEGYFSLLKNRYQNNSNIQVKSVQQNNFLLFGNGKLEGNEIKMYIPLDTNHVLNGTAKIMDFLSRTNIAHQSKLARVIRNDNLVVRVNNLKDAETIMNFVRGDLYIQEGMMNVNPFLPNANGVGMTMDNNYSFNFVIANTISYYLTSLKMQNRINAFSIEGYNTYLQQLQKTERDLELRDIYALLVKTTSKDFKFSDFQEHANNKLADKYNEKRERITNPTYYFENAILQTYLLYPQNPKTAILKFMSGNPKYFTNNNHARDGLIKYVSPMMIQSIMSYKISSYGYPVPDTLEALIDTYLDLIIVKENEVTETVENTSGLFSLLKSAYINTREAYNENQARFALKTLIIEGSAKGFTNRFGDRTRLNESLIGYNIMTVILNGINIDDLKLNDVDEIVNQFSKVTTQGIRR